MLYMRAALAVIFLVNSCFKCSTISNDLSTSQRENYGKWIFLNSLKRMPKTTRPRSKLGQLEEFGSMNEVMQEDNDDEEDDQEAAVHMTKVKEVLEIPRRGSSPNVVFDAELNVYHPAYVSSVCLFGFYVYLRL
uniref:Uncharacterized protein n=1 Tax=Ditylenchus dipsaci TaxID=166011 RepID=A0A915EBU4_9BILA